jgi:hypothetical protein
MIRRYYIIDKNHWVNEQNGKWVKYEDVVPLLELIDGAMEVIETFGETKSQIEWRNQWMKKAKDFIMVQHQMK